MELLKEAIARFMERWEVVSKLDEIEPTSMVLATASASGRPSARVVLLKAVEDDEFLFYTNYESRKGLQLKENPFGALCFFWLLLMEQVRVEGAIRRVDPEVSDAYWRTRPRESQIGAWASLQSTEVRNEGELAARVEETAARFEGVEVPRPEHWGGYRMCPDLIEFWTMKPHRLHDRLVYERGEAGWTRRTLFP